MGSLTEEQNGQEMGGENGEEKETHKETRDVNFNLTAENLEKLSKSIEETAGVCGMLSNLYFFRYCLLYRCQIKTKQIQYNILCHP